MTPEQPAHWTALTPEPTDLESHVAHPALSRHEAAERADLLSVDSYDIELDLTTSDTTFALDDDRHVHVPTSRAPTTWIDLVAPYLVSATLNGEPIDVSGYTGQRLPLPALAAENTLVVVAECAYSRTGEGLHRLVDPVDDEVYLYSQFEDGRRPAGLRLLRPARPEGRVTRSTSRRRTTGRSCRTRPRPRRRPVRAGVARWDFATDGTDDHVHHRTRRQGRTTWSVTSTSVPTAPTRWGSSAATRWLPTSTPTGSSSRDQAGHRLLRAGLRPPLPVRQVRPAVRAGVQRRRDGERRLRDPDGGLHLPLPGDRGRLRVAGEHDPARAGAHVVRRPRHDALVGRPVAQRVVRGVGLVPRHGQGDAVHRRVDQVREPAQDLGLPPGPAALDATRSPPTAPTWRR